MNNFKTQLEDIEKEMEIINDPNKKDISWSEFIEYKQLEARKSQLIKDEEMFIEIINLFDFEKFSKKNGNKIRELLLEKLK